jgi:HTH-type transcriptional regulator/antitoxin HipB
MIRLFEVEFMDDAMGKQKTYSIDHVKDKFIGKTGSLERERYEVELKLDVLGNLIRRTRKDRNLTQEELGKLISVQKAQISKLERNASNMRLNTIIRIFEALNAHVKFQIELDNREWDLTT